VVNTKRHVVGINKHVSAILKRNSALNHLLCTKLTQRVPKKCDMVQAQMNRSELDQLARKITQMNYQKVSAEQYECTATVLRDDE